MKGKVLKAVVRCFTIPRGITGADRFIAIGLDVNLWILAIATLIAWGRIIAGGLR